MARRPPDGGRVRRMEKKKMNMAPRHCTFSVLAEARDEARNPRFPLPLTRPSFFSLDPNSPHRMREIDAVMGR